MRSFIIFLVLTFSAHILLGQDSAKLDSACGTFGIACSLHGKPQPSMLQTVVYVNNSENTKLLQWLISSNPQNKVHGYVGLYFMKKNGYKLSKIEEDEMKKLEKAEDTIDHCLGCIFGLTSSIKSLITKKNLAYYYKWYSRFGYKTMTVMPAIF